MTTDDTCLGGNTRSGFRLMETVDVKRLRHGRCLKLRARCVCACVRSLDVKVGGNDAVDFGKRLSVIGCAICTARKKPNNSGLVQGTYQFSRLNVAHRLPYVTPFYVRTVYARHSPIFNPNCNLDCTICDTVHSA